MKIEDLNNFILDQPPVKELQFKELPWKTFDSKVSKELASINPTSNTKFKLLFVPLFLVGLVAIPMARPALAAFCFSTILFYIIRAIRLWSKTNLIEASATVNKLKVIERVPFKVTIQISWKGYFNPPMLSFLLPFGKNSEQTASTSLEPYDWHKAHRLEFVFQSDLGMGTHPVGPLTIVLSDSFGVKHYCIEIPIEMDVEIEPEFIEISQFLPENELQSLLHGSQFAGRTGHSEIIYGLRPFRFGDSIKYIDWRQSLKKNQFIVKEFEHLHESFATIFIDNGISAHFSYKEISSLEDLRDSAIAIGRCLFENHIPFSFICEGNYTEYSATEGQFTNLKQTIRKLQPSKDFRFSWTVSDSIDLVPPASTAFFLMTSRVEDWEKLMEAWVFLHDKDVKIVLIVCDAHSYANKVSQKAKLFAKDENIFQWIFSSLQKHDKRSSLTGTVERILSRTYVLKPGKPIQKVYNPEVGL